MILQRIKYNELNAKQKESFNFQKVAAKLADYGFNCMWLNDDWQGADFIACHIDGNTFVKVQLKGRLSINKKYNQKNIYVAFNQDDKWYLYPHDQIQEDLLTKGFMKETKSWENNGKYDWPTIPKRLLQYMEPYII